MAALLLCQWLAADRTAHSINLAAQCRFFSWLFFFKKKYFVTANGGKVAKSIWRYSRPNNPGRINQTRTQPLIAGTQWQEVSWRQFQLMSRHLRTDWLGPRVTVWRDERSSRSVMWQTDGFPKSDERHWCLLLLFNSHWTFFFLFVLKCLPEKYNMCHCVGLERYISILCSFRHLQHGNSCRWKDYLFFYRPLTVNRGDRSSASFMKTVLKVHWISRLFFLTMRIKSSRSSVYFLPFNIEPRCSVGFIFQTGKLIFWQTLQG